MNDRNCKYIEGDPKLLCEDLKTTNNGSGIGDNLSNVCKKSDAYQKKAKKPERPSGKKDICYMYEKEERTKCEETD